MGIDFDLTSDKKALKCVFLAQKRQILNLYEIIKKSG